MWHRITPIINNRRMDVILILTGCIVPNCNDCLSVTDVETRKRMYIDSIRWYLNNTPYEIVFCENSGKDLSDYFCEEKRLEILTFADNNDPSKDQSKSSKELAILKYAFENSMKIQPGKLFVKITGRLKYLNIVETINSLRKVPKMDKEYVSCSLGKTNIWADSRFFFFTYPFFTRMFAKLQKVNITFEFERMLGTCTYQMLNSNAGIFEFLPLPQRVSGISGGYGVSYDIADKQYQKMLFTHRLTKILFDLNILPHFKKAHLKEYGNQ